MALFGRESAEAKAARELRQQAERAERDRRREAEEFLQSPAGQARSSRERDESLFQISLDLGKADSSPVRNTRKISDALTSIAAEGWELHSFCTTFVHESSESRDISAGSGQHVAVRGHLVGTYLFTRRPGSVTTSAEQL